MLTERLPTNAKIQQSVQQRRKKGCFFPTAGCRSSSFQTRWHGHHEQRRTPETHISRPGWTTTTHASLLSGGGTYHRSQHLCLNCFRGSAATTFHPTTTCLHQPLTETCSWREQRSEHAILTDDTAHLCQSRGRKLTGTQMLGASEG